MDELFDLFLAYIPTTNLVAPHMRFWPNGGGAIMAYTDKRQETERVVCEWTSVDNGITTITALLHDPNATVGIELPATTSSVPYYDGSEKTSRFAHMYGTNNPVHEVTWTDENTTGRSARYRSPQVQNIPPEYTTTSDFNTTYAELLKRIKGE